MYQTEYHVTQDLKSEMKLSSIFSIYARDIFFMVFMLAIAYVLNFLVAEKMKIVYWVVTVILSVVLVIPSTLNYKRRMYESLIIFLQKDMSVYYPLHMVHRKVIQMSKNKKKKVEKSVLTLADVIPIIAYDKTYQCFRLKQGYMNMVEIRTKDIVNASEDEIEYDIAKLTKFNKLEYESYKIISLNFPCNTLDQQEYVEYKIKQCRNENYKRFLQNSLYELQWVQKNKSKREFYMMYFSDTLDGIKSMDANMKVALNLNEKMLMDMSQEKKEKILFHLMNPASILQGGLENG